MSISRYQDRLSRVGLFEAILWSANPLLYDRMIYEAMLEMFGPFSNTCFTPVGEIGFSLYEMPFVTDFPMDGQLYEEFNPSFDGVCTLSPDGLFLFYITILRCCALRKCPNTRD